MNKEVFLIKRVPENSSTEGYLAVDGRNLMWYNYQDAQAVIGLLNSQHLDLKAWHYEIEEYKFTGHEVVID